MKQTLTSLLLFPFTKYLFVEGKKCPITIDDKLFKFWHFNRKKRKTLMTHAGLVRAIGNADDKRSDKLCKNYPFPVPSHWSKIENYNRKVSGKIKTYCSKIICIANRTIFFSCSHIVIYKEPTESNLNGADPLQRSVERRVFT